jgi:hypothetical protein
LIKVAFGQGIVHVGCPGVASQSFLDYEPPPIVSQKEVGAPTVEKAKSEECNDER